jgi:PQQ-dependent dehydrogenase (methanol/ethanol family)
MRRGWLLGGAAVVGMAALAQSAMANEELLVMQENPANWVMPLGNYSSTRYSQLGQINKNNVGDLQVAWTFSTGVLRGHEGGPLVIGDVMYIHTPFPNIVYALDLNDPGRVIWKYEPQQDPDTIPVMCCDTVNRGPAYADGKLFLHQADTTLVALDAQTGEVLWTAVNGDPKKGETGTSAPMVIGDKVLIGISGGEFGVQGHVTAYDVNSGEMVWRGYSTGPDDQTLMDPEATTHLGQPVGENSGTATWEGDQWQLGGGTTWGWMSYDPELHLVYYGSGNPGTWNPVQRPGDNRWSMTIFARNPDTGVAKWVYQMTPHDEWDYDGVNEMILADLQFDGKTRKTLVHFDRNGFGYTLSRDRRIARRREVRPRGQLGDPRRQGDRPAAGGAALLDRPSGRGRQHHQHLPGGARHEGPAASGLLADDGTVLRADQPRLHGLRAVPGVLHRRPAVRRRDA